MSPQGPPSQINTTRPHPARMYDYYLGGKDNYPADREAAEGVMRIHPTVGIMARANRAFMHRATRWLARQGIRQFLDIGTGIPTEPNLHQIAQAENRCSRVVYVDNDPIVLAHADALLRSTPEGRTTYIHGDVRQPRGILDAPELHNTLDFSEPVALSLHALLHFVRDEGEVNARSIVRTLMAPLAPGSYLVLGHATPDFDPETWHRVEDHYIKRGIPAKARTRAEVTQFFEGLELVEPGIVICHRWRPDGPPEEGTDDAAVSMLAGVGRKPLTTEEC